MLRNLAQRFVYAVPMLTWVNRKRRELRQARLAPPADGTLLKRDGAQLQAAETYGVCPDIHLQDYIFRHYCTIFGGDVPRAYSEYFANGRISAEKIRDLASQHLSLSINDGRVDAPLSILDFASGYGCAARHLPTLFPSATITAMDIHDQAYSFNTECLRLLAEKSKADPADLHHTRQYTVVSALSFFSHIPRAMFLPWLTRLAQFVAPGGLLIITTHGEISHRQHMAHINVDSDGFGFIADSEQFDLPVNEYGNAVTYRAFMESQIGQLKDMRQEAFHPGFWWGHQDAYVLRKTG